MAVKSTGLNVRGLRAAFFERLAATPTFFGAVTTRIESDTDSEQHRWLGSVPQMREWGTGRKSKGLRVESYNIRNKKYETTLDVDRDEIDDDQTAQIGIRTQELAVRAATHKDYLISQLLINGESAGFTAYDGKVFFATDHESGASGVQSNLLTYDISDTAAAGETDLIVAPTPLQFGLALQTAVQAMAGYKDDQGEPNMLSATGLVAMVPTSMLFAARAAVENPRVGSFAGGDQTNVTEAVSGVIMNPWLTDMSKWYLLKVDGVIRPFIFQDRAPIEFNALNNPAVDTDVFMTEQYKFGVRARYAIAYGEWRNAVRVDFIT